MHPVFILHLLTLDIAMSYAEDYLHVLKKNSFLTLQQVGKAYSA